MTQSEAPTIHAVERTCQVLESLKRLDGATVTEVADDLDVSKSSAYNHLYTLRQQGFVEKRGDEYRVGLKVLDLVGYERDRHPLYEIGARAALDLANETGEAAALTTENGGRSVYLYHSSGEHAVSYDSHLGVRLPMHATAAGKAMLAQLPTERVDEIVDEHGLEEYTPNTVTSPEALREELEAIRDRGYALDDEERIVGMRGVGAPVVDESTGTLLGAIAIGGASATLQGDRFTERLPETVMRHARSIEISATYS